MTSKIEHLPQTLEQRIAALEANAHPPFDFTHVITRLADLERQIRELVPDLADANPVSFIIAYRDHKRIAFMDLHAKECSLQEHAISTKPALWLGTNTHRMLLDQKLAAWLLQPLSHFAEHGTLPEGTS